MVSGADWEVIDPIKSGPSFGLDVGHAIVSKRERDGTRVVHLVTVQADATT